MKSLSITLITLFSIGLCYPLVAQKVKPKFKKAGVTKLDEATPAFSQSDILLFPNVNAIPFYQNDSKLRSIQQLTSSGDKEKLYVMLRDYVSDFGIENFRKNIPMIWQLAELSLEYGPEGESRILYKLALRHHQQGVDIQNMLKVYDSIETDKKQYYVPLDHYYQLVDYRKEIDTLRPPHAVLLNMGYEVNSHEEDYGPSIGLQDDILFFTSKRNQHYHGSERIFDEDLFYSRFEYGAWSKAQEFRDINSSFNEGSACLSPDGKHLYFSRCNAPESIGHCDIYISTLQSDSTWTVPVNLGPEINSSAWDSHPALTHSGDTLFFASSRVGGFGLTDIYFSVKNKDGKWQKALNAGPVVNTIQSEVSPFFHHTFDVLYFSSDGHPLNFGKFDIYKSYFVLNGWSEPINIGPLVNGPGSEYYFTIDSKSSTLYYSRSEQEDLKNLDLFSFPVPMEAQPEAITNLKGSLTDSQTGNPLRGIVSIIDLDQGVEVAPKFLREDGTFDFSLINKRNYLLIIQGDEYFRIEELFFLDGAMEINKMAEPIESKIEFKSLEFENGKADILFSMHDDLKKLADFLIDHPDLHVNISGHTDSQGREEANRKLSQDRADSIKKFLVDNFKLDESRISAIGYGSSEPIIQNESTDDHRQINRRVEFEISRTRN